MLSSSSIGMSSTSRTTISFGVLLACVADAAASRMALGLMRPGAFFNAFRKEGAAASFALLFGFPRDCYSGFRGGKLNLPIFCIVTVASSWQPSDTLSSLLDERLASLSLHARTATGMDGTLPQCSFENL